MHRLVGSLVIVVIPSILIVSSYDYGLLGPGAARPMPPEIAAMFVNKSESQLETEDCMKDLVECLKLGALKNSTICACNKFGTQRSFITMCDMGYENCKGSVTWEYLYDGGCRKPL